MNKVIVKYLDGRMLKGITSNFSPANDTFHLNVAQTNEEEEKLGMRQIDTSEGLKAIFFVKDFAGKPGYKEREEFLPQDDSRGKKITIEFDDGEKLNALSMGYSRKRKGFFVNPVDPDSNNDRIYIISDTVKDIEAIP